MKSTKIINELRLWFLFIALASLTPMMAMTYFISKTPQIKEVKNNLAYIAQNKTKQLERFLQKKENNASTIAKILTIIEPREIYETTFKPSDINSSKFLEINLKNRQSLNNREIFNSGKIHLSYYLNNIIYSKKPIKRIGINYDYENYQLSEIANVLDNQITVSDWIYLPFLQGRILAQNNTSETLSYLTTLKKIVIIFGIFTLVVVILTAFLVKKSISVPVVKLTQVVQELARSNQNQQVPDLTHDEINQLAQSFNFMGQQLRECFQTIQEKEQELASTKEQLKVVLDAVPGSISWIDSDGRYIAVNRHLAEKFNLSQEAFVGKKLGFMQQNDKLSSFLCEFIKSSENSASSIIDFEVKQEKRYYLVAAQKYQQGDAIVSVGIDITERKQAEEALKQSESTTRALIEAIPDLLLRVRGDGVYLDDAIGAGRVKRFSGDNIALNTTTVYDSLPPAQAQQRMDTIKLALETKTLQMYEQQLLIDGQLIDEEVRVIVTGENEVLVMVRDITDRKRAEAALRIAEENYRSIFENALEGIFQSSPEGRFLKVNSAMAEIYGYDSPQEMIETIKDIGRQIYVDPLDQAEFQRLLEENDRINDFEYRVYQKDGSVIWIQEDTRAVRDHQGQLLYYEGMIQDITDRKNREDDLRRQLEELKIEIDHKKREKEVAMLTGSSYFQEVQQEIAEVNLEEFWS
ncbi:PAS domain-containing protein [[Phormidium ambiguum] IAM M-71]|uniref:PAS domain-containing protein n=1 Tax=[Phormidium ambiguum] IAM M-71 TaxID=454136 RepID=UPI0009FCA00C|nr:PAS domain-containing protein [Phormidium ambiguum]